MSILNFTPCWLNNYFSISWGPQGLCPSPYSYAENWNLDCCSGNAFDTSSINTEFGPLNWLIKRSGRLDQSLGWKVNDAQFTGLWTVAILGNSKISRRNKLLYYINTMALFKFMSSMIFYESHGRLWVPIFFMSSIVLATFRW